MKQVKQVRLTIRGGMAALVCLSLAAQAMAQGPASTVDARMEAFQHEIQRLQRDSTQVTPEAISSLITQSFELGRPQATAVIVKSYLARHRDPSLALLLQAAQVAEWAGDIRMAVSRYKQALKMAPNAATTSDTANRLFRLQVYDLGTTDDAFRLMTEMGEAARESPALKRFDSWYLSQALLRKDVPAVTRRLSSILADQMPLDLERQAYWDVLEAVMRDFAIVRPELYSALPDCRRIVESGLIRGNEAWNKRFAFLTANLAFAAGTVTMAKDAAAQAREFEPVARAARAYIDAAPTAEALREIEFVFSGGWDKYDASQMIKCFEAKAAVFAYAFGKLNNAQRDAILLTSLPNWDVNARIPMLTTREQYAQLAAAHADYFRQSAATGRIPMLADTITAAECKALAPKLQGIPNADALAIAALGASDDLAVCLQRVIQESGLCNSFEDISKTMDRVWARYRGFQRPDGRIADDHYERVLAKVGVETLSRTPHFLIDVNLARAYVVAAWRHSGSDNLDKSKVAAAFHALDWVPYSQRERADVFGAAIAEFRAWSESVRLQQRSTKSAMDSATRDLALATQARDKEAKNPTANLAPFEQRIAVSTKKIAEQKEDLAKQDAAVNQFSQLEELFRQVKDVKIADLSKAPDDFCRNLARAVVAERDKNLAAFLEAARALYPLAREYATKKTPYGRAALGYLFKNRFATFDTLDFQCELVADQLTRGTPANGNSLLVDMMAMIEEGRSWNKEQRLKLNAVLAKGLREMLARKQYDAKVFDWFLNSRKGPGWSESERDQDIMETLINQPELLAAQPDRVIFLMSCIWTHFPKLAEKYPLGTWFDDVFAEECRRRRFVDGNYGKMGGRDNKGVVLKATADVFQSYDRLPFGYAGVPALWTDRSAFWATHSRPMFAPPAMRDAMLTQIESCFGKTRFDFYANGNARLSTLSLDDAVSRKRYFDLLNTWLDAREREPVKSVSPSIGPVIKVLNDQAHPDRRDFSPAELNTLLRVLQLAPEWNWQEYYFFDRILHDALFAAKRYKDMFVIAPHLWGMARSATVDGDKFRQNMVDTVNKLADSGQSDLAASYAEAGLQIIGNALKETQRSALMAIKSKALSGVSAAVSVELSDRRYPLFQAQANYQIGRVGDAWLSAQEHHALFPDSFRDLDPEFSIWLINKLTEVGNYESAEKYTSLMIQWVDQTPQSFVLADRVRLLLAQANIPFQRQEYPKAKAICEQITANKEFEDVLERYNADLKIAEIDRLTKKYDEACERLENMLRKKHDAYVQTEANHQLAWVKFAQEEYTEAKVCVEKVLEIMPAHINARFLQGEINLKVKKYVEVTDLIVGQGSKQQVIVPGRPLRVTLDDKNLAVVGRESSIEVRAWTDSGDEEVFTLQPFGDSKTKFQGAIITVLGAKQKHDKVLQVLGGDNLRIDYSEAFKRANKIVGIPPTPIRVVSDGELYASSGKIESKEESEQRETDRLIRERLKLDAEAAGKKEAPVEALSAQRANDEVKPGNRINVRVIDPGASTTTNRNKLYVKAVASSGDRINRIELLETAPNSGVFDGSIPTVPAPAMAMALDSAEGTEPGFAITTVNYPPWSAMPDNRPPKWFGVDMNTRNTLGQMKIDADEAGRHLRKLLVQTSLNGVDFTSVGAWPENLPVWLGNMRMEVARYKTTVQGGMSIDNIKNYLDVGYIVSDCGKVFVNPRDFAVNWEPSQNMDGVSDRLQIERDGAGSFFVGRLQGTFYQPVRQKRIFRVAGTDPEKPPQNCFIVLDGAGVSGKGSEKKSSTMVAQSISKGMHKVEVYFSGSRKTGLNFWLETAEIQSQMSFARCDPAMFAPPTNIPPRELAQAIQAVAFRPAAIESAPGNGSFSVAFATNTQARAVRLWLLDYEGEAPAIRKLHLTSSDGRKILPAKEDVVKLRENNQLEIIPGDKISLSYENQHALTKERQFNEAFLKVTYFNANIRACFVESSEKDGTRTARYTSMRRFNLGDTVNVFITDPDADTNDACNVVSFQVLVGQDSQPKTFKALETEPHSGVFLGKVFPVAGEPQRPVEVHMEPFDDLQFSYLDMENTDPGIPWERSCMVEQATYTVPEFYIGYSHSKLLDDGARKQRVSVGARPTAKSAKLTDEVIPATRAITAGLLLPTNTAAEAIALDLPAFSNKTSVLLGCQVFAQVVHPTIALSPSSYATMYIQTESGRKRYGQPLQGEFDLNVPGTLRLIGRPGSSANISAPVGYASVTYDTSILAEQTYLAEEALDLGQFMFSVPMRLGEVPEKSYAVESEDVVKAPVGPGEIDWSKTLAVCGGEIFYMGYQYTDEQGTNHWLTGTSTMTSDAFFDVMDRRFTEAVTNRNVGESIYLRVIDPGLDGPDNKKTIDIEVNTTSGLKQSLQLFEVSSHSGVYKGNAKLIYADDVTASNQTDVVRVNYGDNVTLQYCSQATSQTLSHTVYIFKGEDGSVLQFTKRFKDQSIAVQTQFTLAEAYFEMAKKHRELSQPEVARREIAQGKKLLEEAIRDYPASEIRAQADYLLANLSIEYAMQVKDDAQKLKYYLDAITRFSDIVGNYPDGPYAPKAQFRKALTYEKMGRIDEACEEYVKLSYRYPDHELVAETIARLGQYFLGKGKGIEEESKQETDALKKEKIRLQAVDLYKTAAQVFGRLCVRFPEHQLAVKTAVLSGQCWMRANDVDQAIKVFTTAIDNKKGSNELLAEAMYWCGDAYMRRKKSATDPINAYRMFKRLTWDYPETTFAKYARGRLSEPELAKIDE